MVNVSSDEILQLVEKLSAELHAQAAKLEAVTAILRSSGVHLPPDHAATVTPSQQIARPSEAATADVQVHSNFIAEGPGQGFKAQAGTNDGMDVGVLGIGSKAAFDEIAGTVGVVGLTATLDGGLANGTSSDPIPRIAR